MCIAISFLDSGVMWCDATRCDVMHEEVTGSGMRVVLSSGVIYQAAGVNKHWSEPPNAAVPSRNAYTKNTQKRFAVIGEDMQKV